MKKLAQAPTILRSFAGHELRLASVTAGHFLDNPASGQVLEKIGFRPTGQVLPRYSAGRREAAPCRLFRLDFGSEAQSAADMAAENERELVAA